MLKTIVLLVAVGVAPDGEYWSNSKIMPSMEECKKLAAGVEKLSIRRGWLASDQSCIEIDMNKIANLKNS